MYDLGEYEQSLEYYEKALENIEDNPITFINKANVLFRLKKFNDVDEAYDKAYQIDVKDEDGNIDEERNNQKNIHVLLQKGATLSYIGKCNDAIDKYDIALKIDPKNIDLLLHKGTALLKLKKYDDAGK